jgi:PIN domain nuclease of toxin-antitoxin system
MKLLLDSQAVIWYVDQDQLLTATAHAAITDPINDLLLSAASIWEIAIKAGIGKLPLNLPYRDWMHRAITDLDLAILPVTVEYAAAQSALPWHHRDPFDRMLIAQALTEGFPIVSADAQFDAYGVTRLW